jgi:ABC-2 type transport system permease protein
MNALARQIGLETKIFVRERQNLFLTMAFPLILIFIFGSVFSGQSWSGISAINYLLPGIIVTSLMMACMNNNALKIVNEREKGVYRRLSLTPLKRGTLLLGNIIVRYLIAMASTLLLIAVGVGLFKADMGGNYLLLWLVWTLGSLTFIVIGFVLASLVKNTNSMMTLGMAALFPLMFLGGCFWPIDEMPAFLVPVCEALPTLRLNTALRMITVQNAGFGDIWGELPVVLYWLAGGSVLSVLLFKWE